MAPLWLDDRSREKLFHGRDFSVLAQKRKMTNKVAMVQNISKNGQSTVAINNHRLRAQPNDDQIFPQMLSGLLSSYAFSKLIANVNGKDMNMRYTNEQRIKLRIDSSIR